jgi:hypothetical protein
VAVFALAVVLSLIAVILLAGVVTPLWMRVTPSDPATASAFTGSITLVAAIAVLVVYWRQAGIMERQENLQRAWVVAGMGPSHTFARDAMGEPMNGPNGRPRMRCQPNCHNYGQTPAFLKYLEWGFCFEPAPATPDWGACTRTEINNWVGTSQGPFAVTVSPDHEMIADTVIFYGRVTYLDVLKRERYCGFIYRWHINGTHDRLGGEYPKYVEWQ